jgi:thioredoxin-dependent peroxiredoxin
MRLTTNEQAPDFITTDVFGNVIHLKKLRGQKVYLGFKRNAGCPVCNLRVHELLKKSDYFVQNNIKVILIYESTVSKMQEYLTEKSYPFYFVADPQNKLYTLYAVERSYGKLFKSLLHGLVAKARSGSKLFKEPIKQDGHMQTIPSEFLIGEDGKLKIVHYGNFIGDHMPIELIH